MNLSSDVAPRWILHPTFIAASFVLSIAFANDVEPAGFGRTLVVAVVLAGALTAVAWALADERLLGGLIATSLILAAISLRPLDSLWETVRAAFGVNAARGVIGGVFFVALSIPAFLIVRAAQGKAPVRGPVTWALNRLSAVLLAIVVAFHVIPGLPRFVAETTQRPEALAIDPAAALPDIYMILMDGYPRADVLERRFGIDNAPFVEELRSRGFDVANGSRSNYVFTQVTLASMFQMQHLDEVDGLADLIGAPGSHVTELRDAITRSPVWATLRTAGYRTVVNLAGYEHVSLRDTGADVLDHGEMTDFERVVLGRTWLLDVLKRYVPNVYTQPWRDRILHSFGDLEELAATTRPGTPTFAWVHIPAPHLPLVLKADGTTRKLDARRFDPATVEGFGLSEAELRQAYSDELAYLNGRLLRVIGKIEESATRTPDRPEPVVVIFSDHGYYYDTNDTQARFANFLATSTPGSPALFEPTPTPVNFFRTLFNEYLGTDIAAAEDRYFLSPDIRNLLELTEVPNPDRP